MTKRVAIIGAGPAGMACARMLCREEGFTIDIYDDRESVGGLCGSFKACNQIVDYGPHLLYLRDQRATDFYYSNVQDDELIEVPRFSRIFYRNKYFLYPVRVGDALRNLGFWESVRCVLSFIKGKLFPLKGDSFEDWVANSFGYRLYSIFFKVYSEKVWGVKCTSLDKSFAQQRMKKLDLLETIKEALKLKNTNEVEETSITHFRYPKFGSGVVYEHLADELRANGVTIHLNTEVVKIHTKDHKATGIDFYRQGADGDRELHHEDYDIVVSSAPFTEMVKSIDEVDERTLEYVNKLRYRNTVLAFVEVDNDHVGPDQWLYVVSNDVQFGRMTNFGNWSTYMKLGAKTNILCLEYWMNDEDELWNLSETDFISLVRKDVTTAQFATEAQIKSVELKRIHRSYPVYAKGYLDNLRPVYHAMDDFRDLYFIGRNGAFKYNNQDHSIVMGMLCADKIMGRYQGSLWDVNTDNTYQYVTKAK